MSRSTTHALAFLLALGACTATDGAGEPIGVSLGEFSIAFDDPVPAGSALTFAVTNAGQAPHTLATDVGEQTLETAVLNAGESDRLAVPALAAGPAVFYCSVPGHREAGMAVTVRVGGDGGGAGMSNDEMDREHEAVMKRFPAKTDGEGGKPLAHRTEGGVKVFDLTVDEVRWEVTPGQVVDAYAYNGQIPGPEIRVRRGDRVRFNVRNALDQSTTVHFHGLTVPNAMDGVPFLTQPPIKPGASFTYEFPVVDTPGTYMYHSHHNATEQVGRGLLGAVVIESARKDWDAEATVIVGDGPLGYTLNGKGFPATKPITATVGQRVLLRFLNEGQQIHPMHLHGFHFTVIARDGSPVAPYTVDTLSVAPGERYDAVFDATMKGAWAFHCHVLSHVEGAHGMFGMATAVIVS